jgi:hypothetical protein
MASIEQVVYQRFPVFHPKEGIRERKAYKSGYPKKGLSRPTVFGGQEAAMAAMVIYNSMRLHHLMHSCPSLESLERNRIELATATERTFEKEKSAFLRQRSTLQSEPRYVGKYVAIVGGTVVDSDEADGKLVERVYRRYGYVPMYVGKVDSERAIEFSSPE